MAKYLVEGEEELGEGHLLGQELAHHLCVFGVMLNGPGRPSTDQRCG